MTEQFAAAQLYKSNKQQPITIQTNNDDNNNNIHCNNSNTNNKPIKRVVDTTSLKDTTNTSNNKDKLFSGLAGGFFNTNTKQSNNNTVQQSTKQQPKIIVMDEEHSDSDKRSSSSVNTITDTHNTEHLLNIQTTLKQQLDNAKITQQQLTMNLIQKLQTKPHLLKLLQQSKIQQAFSELQSNPTSAIKKYSNDKEVNTFLVEFMELMGNELTSIEQKTNK